MLTLVQSKLVELFLVNSNFQLFNGFIQIIKTYYKHRTTLKLTVNKYEHGSKPEKSMNERSRKAYFPRMEEKLVQQFKKQRKKRENSEKMVVSINSQKDYE